MQRQKPKVYLNKARGGMFVVIRECITAAKDAGWEDEDIEKWCENAVKGDHDHLMKCVEESFHVLMD